VRDKVTQLERRCDRLVWDLEEAASALHSAWHQRDELEVRNRALMDPIVRAKMLEPAPAIIMTCKCATMKFGD
jgi:hypothetical protein